MVGRNDPCPCGSGKKYKKCCLTKDQEAWQAQVEAERAVRQAAAASLPPPLPAAQHLPPAAGTDDALGDGPETEAEADAITDSSFFDTRWAEFESAENDEDQIAIFLATLDEGAMDNESAFEMLNVIYQASVASGERDRFDALLALLRQRQPDVYAHDAHFYAGWLISNALAAGRMDALPALAHELADTAGEDLDTVSGTLDQLAYHGHLSVVTEAMRRACPLVRDAGEYFEWAVTAFAERALTYARLDYLERTAAPHAAELEALSAAFDCAILQPGDAAQFLAHITGQAERRWTLDDFTLTPHRRRKGAPGLSADDGRTNLYYLTVEFLGYLRRAEGMPYAKGEIARDQIQRYILKRHAGELNDANGRRGARPKARASAPVHPLCPDHDTMDRFLARLLSFLSSQPYRAAALFEMLPAWLRFLEARELIDADQRVRTLRELDGLVPDLIKVLHGYRSDSALRLAAEHWGENDGLRPARRDQAAK